MKPTAFCPFVVSLVFFVLLAPMRSAAQAQADVILPAGTLLRCTLNEPNFSSKTVAVGDPVICNLAEVSLFGRPAFPRGAYLGGHLEADKEPGHFVGKGYLNIQFDQLGTPEGLLPVPAKIISARGYKVDRDGKIIGRGHPDRDAVEWMLPPLWPIKVLTLPARGPRPTLKGEEQLVLRLMDDIDIPSSAPAQAQFAPARPSAGTRVGPYDALPSRYIPRLPAPPPQAPPAPPAPARQNAVGAPALVRNVVVFRNGSSYLVTNIRVEGSRLVYTKPDGGVEATPLAEVDWTKTFQFNAEQGTALTLGGPAAPR